MANPTRISAPIKNPAIETRAFGEHGVGAEAFAEAKRAEGYRAKVTRRFNGRDLGTKKKRYVTVVHVYAKKEA